MATTLEELEQSFGGSSAAAAPASSLEDLERSFAPGAEAIPKDKNTVASAPPKPTAPEFEPGFMGGAKKAFTQIGAGMSDPVMGVKQLTGGATEADVDEKRARDAALIGDSTMGKANYLLGKVAPALTIPALGGGIAPVMAYNSIVGALQGATEPVGTGDSRGLNTAAGALGGVAAPGLVKLIGSAMKPASDAAGDLARRAMAMGIPLGPKDITSSRFMKAISSLLDDLPITGPVGAHHASEVGTAINKNVAKTAGMDTDVLDQAAVAAQRKVLGSKFDKLWENPVELDANLFGALESLPDKLRLLKPGQGDAFSTIAQDIMKKAELNPQTGKLTIPGQYVNELQQALGSMSAGGQGLEKKIAGDFQRELLDAFGRSTPPGAQKELAQLKSQWKSLTKVIEPLVNSAEAGVMGREAGQLPLGLLSNQAKTAYGKNLHTSPYADLAPIAGRFGVNRSPQTGGSIRALVQGGVAPAALGTGAYMLGSGTPLAALLGGAALTGTAGVAAQKMMTSPTVARRIAAAPVKRALLGAPALGPALREMTGTALSRGSAAGALGLAASASRAEPSALEEE